MAKIYQFFRDLIGLARVYQWYKNLVILLPLFFHRKIFDIASIETIIMGLLVLCLISSVNYIINDSVDAKKDRLHPEKKRRPIASGRIKIWQAAIFASMIFAIAIFISSKMSNYFTLCAVMLFVLTQLYTFWLKNVPFADILMISTNFVLRAASGVFLINAAISPWLVLCPFFLALFLAVAKRDANVKLLGKNAAKFRPILKYYSAPITNALMIVTTTCLIMSYALYAFLNYERQLTLLLTLPFAFYIIFRYLYLVYSGSDIPADPHKAIKDWHLIIGVLLWGASTFIALYYYKIIAIIL
ncbi:hypothetical protein COV93_00350 [Candidatus Woesearchaeota archaeon CG11_big_fil_rev_8_21_14_0_20_43_8]|nr:MAG: hypothetical protein COV93_00350 [Candidatus Woesearchaeota archaeon CG11_big_fil_rev_8_21_14_0_20_43_8]